MAYDVSMMNKGAGRSSDVTRPMFVGGSDPVAGPAAGGNTGMVNMPQNQQNPAQAMLQSMELMKVLKEAMAARNGGGKSGGMGGGGGMGGMMGAGGGGSAAPDAGGMVSGAF